MLLLVAIIGGYLAIGIVLLKVSIVLLPLVAPGAQRWVIEDFVSIPIIPVLLWPVVLICGLLCFLVLKLNWIISKLVEF